VPAARFRAELDALGEASALRVLTPGGSPVRAPRDDAEPADRWQPA
jgi:hypothetical protein